MLKDIKSKKTIKYHASVTELADVWDLKSQGRNTVRVRSPPFAPCPCDEIIGRHVRFKI